MTDSEQPSTRPPDGVAASPGDGIPSSDAPGGTFAAREDETSSSRPRRADRSKGSEPGVGAFLKELPVLLLVAFVLAFLLRTFVIQVFYIPSQSMEPTLQVNDRMVVEKVTYQFRDPARGEVVVFEGELTNVASVDESVGTQVVRGVGQFLGLVPANARDFVKRVIGLPGDVITVEDGVVSVNDVPIDEPYVVYGENKTQGPYEVPEGKLFFLGDNRPNSSDSRYTLGMVDLDRVVGRAVVIIWPFDHLGGLTGADYPSLDAEAALPADPPDELATGSLAEAS